MAETVGANERVRQYIGRREKTSARDQKIARTVEKNNKRSPSEHFEIFNFCVANAVNEGGAAAGTAAAASYTLARAFDIHKR